MRSQSGREIGYRRKNKCIAKINKFQIVEEDESSSRYITFLVFSTKSPPAGDFRITRIPELLEGYTRGSFWRAFPVLAG